jgi:hypothetical protein
LNPTLYIYINIYCPWNEWVYENDAQPVLRRMLKEGRKEGRKEGIAWSIFM